MLLRGFLLLSVQPGLLIDIIKSFAQLLVGILSKRICLQSLRCLFIPLAQVVRAFHLSFSCCGIISDAIMPALLLDRAIPPTVAEGKDEREGCLSKWMFLLDGTIRLRPLPCVQWLKFLLVLVNFILERI